MDMITRLKNINEAPHADIVDAIASLDEEAKCVLNSIVEHCKKTDLDAAWDCIAELDKIKVIRELLCGLRDQPACIKIKSNHQE
jgi:hypothetical protein